MLIQMIGYGDVMSFYHNQYRFPIQYGDSNSAMRSDDDDVARCGAVAISVSGAILPRRNTKRQISQCNDIPVLRGERMIGII